MSALGFGRSFYFRDAAIEPFLEPASLNCFHAYKIKKTAVPKALAASRNSFEYRFAIDTDRSKHGFPIPVKQFDSTRIPGKVKPLSSQKI